MTEGRHNAIIYNRVSTQSKTNGTSERSGSGRAREARHRCAKERGPTCDRRDCPHGRGQATRRACTQKLGDKENPYARFAAIGLVERCLPPRRPGSRPTWRSSPPTTSATSAPQPRSCWNSLDRLPRRPPKPWAEALATEMDEAIRDQFVDALIAMGPGAKPALPALLPLAADSTLPVGRRRRSSRPLPRSTRLRRKWPRCSWRQRAKRISRSAPPPPWQWGNQPPSTASPRQVDCTRQVGPRTDPRAAALRALAEAGPRARSVRSEIEPLGERQQRDGLALWAKIAIAAMDGDATKAASAIRAGLADKKPDLRAAAVGALLDIGPKPED